MKRVEEKRRKRGRRKIHIRKRISGSESKPRLSVFKSNKHIYVQAIDDVAGNTIASASNVEAEFKSLTNSVENAEKIGQAIGERLMAKKIDTVVFDRNGFVYHGIVKSVADGARKAGLKF
jgi:large subunit ribosomal protein L18